MKNILNPKTVLYYASILELTYATYGEVTRNLEAAINLPQIIALALYDGVKEVICADVEALDGQRLDMIINELMVEHPSVMQPLERDINRLYEHYSNQVKKGDEAVEKGGVPGSFLALPKLNAEGIERLAREKAKNTAESEAQKNVIDYITKTRIATKSTVGVIIKHCYITSKCIGNRIGETIVERFGGFGDSQDKAALSDFLGAFSATYHLYSQASKLTKMPITLIQFASYIQGLNIPGAMSYYLVSPLFKTTIDLSYAATSGVLDGIASYLIDKENGKEFQSANLNMHEVKTQMKQDFDTAYGIAMGKLTKSDDILKKEGLGEEFAQKSYKLPKGGSAVDLYTKKDLNAGIAN